MAVFGAINILKTFQRIRTQGEAETGTLWCMHCSIGPDVKRFGEQFPHPRHIALGYFQDMAVRRRRGHVDTGGEQDCAAPGMGGETYATGRGERGNAADFCMERR